MRSFKVEYDTEYGCDKRTGWSVCINGSYVSELERFFLVAMFKGLFRYYSWKFKRNKNTNVGRSKDLRY